VAAVTGARIDGSPVTTRCSKTRTSSPRKPRSRPLTLALTAAARPFGNWSSGSLRIYDYLPRWQNSPTPVVIVGPSWNIGSHGREAT
jgi:hypothetical protein